MFEAAARQGGSKGCPAGKCSPGRRPDIISSPAARKRQPVGAYPVALRFGRWGSRCAPRQWSGRRSPQKSSARGPEEVVRRGFPGDAAARLGGSKGRPGRRESRCAPVCGPEGGRARKTRPLAARKRQPVGAYPVALRSGRQGSSCAPDAAARRVARRGGPAGGRVVVRLVSGPEGGGARKNRPPAARQDSSKGRPGGEMQSGTSARHYLFARGPAKAARQRQPGEGGPEGFTRWRCGPAGWLEGAARQAGE